MVNRLVGPRPARGLALRGRLLRRRLRRRWKIHLLQCGLSALALLMILLVVDVVLHAAIAVAIASSAFIVFVMPHGRAAAPRRVIGGHLLAVVVGYLASLLYHVPGLGEAIAGSHLVLDVVAAAAVGLNVLLMVSTSTEHPPAAGTALGLVVDGWALSAVTVVLLGAVMLSAAHALLRPRLANLF